MILPIEHFKEEILRTVTENTVTIIQGATGCGKSTKVPSFLYEETGKKILVTQPRRLAAISLAKKVAKDLGINGDIVGYHTSLQSDFSNYSKIIFLTEGTEMIRQLINKEDLDNTILIIDEVHEWSVNVDLLIAFAKKLISTEHSNFKLVLMSATLESNKLSTFFDNAPIITIPTNNYPVCSLEKPSCDLEDILINLVKHRNNVLVFLPGKVEIYQLKKKLHSAFKSYGLRAKILPLHGDLSSQEQQEIYKMHFFPKVILSTNIAQTSITISDIDAIVDTGLGKTLTTSNGTSTLIQDQVSNSDILQRKGRVGRTKPGNYYLCSDYKNERIEYPIPEIFYSDMSNNMLMLTKFHIDIKSLNFYHEPNWNNVEDALTLLKQLDAIDSEGNITDIGNQMCKLPLDVRFSRMLVEAKKYDVQTQVDILLCALIVEIGQLDMNCNNATAISLRSDLFYQVKVFKDIYHANTTEEYNLVNYNKILQYLPRLLSILGINILEIEMKDSNISLLKKCLASGWPDCLFIFKRGAGYFNSDFSECRVPYRSSSLSTGGHQYLVGLPMNFIDHTISNNSYKRILVPTAFTLDEVLENFSSVLTEQYSMNAGKIYRKIVYHGIEITEILIGDIEELRISDPSAFHEESEYYPKFKQTYISLYYHNLKISSRVKI